MKKILLIVGIGITFPYSASFGMWSIFFKKSVVQNEDEVNKPDKDGLTQLEKILDFYHENNDEEADTVKKINVVKALITAKADLTRVITQGRNKGMTPLALAVSAQGNNIRMVKLLLAAKADVNQNVRLIDMDSTPFALAIKNERKFIALLLIEYKADVNSAIGIRFYGGNALHKLATSVRVGDDEDHFVNDLLEAGADSTLHDTQGMTPLAVYKNHFMMAQQPGYSRFAHVVRRYWDTFYRQCFLVLDNQCAVPTVLIVVITEYLKDTELSKVPLTFTKTVDYQWCGGDLQKGLEEAIQTGSSKGVKDCIKKGADLTKAHAQGDLPIHQAIRSGKHQNIIAMLIDAGSKINSLNKDGYTPLHLAVATNNSASVRLLLKAGATREPADAHGMTPLYLAAEKGYAPLVMILTNEGANNNTCDEHGLTPLHKASENGHATVVDILLKAGADKGVKNKHGLTPLKLAEKHDHTQVIQILRAASDQMDHYMYLGSRGYAPGYFETPWGHH